MSAIPWVIMLGAIAVAAWDDPGAALFAAGYFGFLAIFIAIIFRKRL